MQRCAHCGHYGRRSTHCSSRKKKPRRKAPRPRQHADKNDRKRGILPTECFIPVGTPRYFHKPFDDTRCIRLLVLLPGNKWDPVRCELFVRSLDDAQYEAISYAWGPEEERGDILCHDQRLSIPWNLEHGLRKFRRLRRKRVLWADSVCINQDDTAERGHQVQNMSKVYERAKRVLVWLGADDCFNPSALFEFIRVLGPLPPPDDQSAGYVDCQINYYGSKHWPTLTNVAQTDWFDRLWVIQEICLASSAIIHYGPASLDWEYLVAFCAYMFDNHPKVIVGHDLAVISTIARLQQLRFRTPGHSLPLVFYFGRVKDCSNPSDRIYALLGHRACLDTISNPQSKLYVPVNYSTSYKDLYTSVAIQALRAESFLSLDIINFVSHTSFSIDDHEIGSWVPRWELNEMIPLIQRQIYSRYMAHGKTTVEASLNGICLSVAGFTFDSVAWVSEPFDSTSGSFPSEPSNAFDHANPHPFFQTWYHIQNTGSTDSRSMLITMCSLLTGSRMTGEKERRFISGAVTYAYSMGLDISAVEDLVALEDVPYFCMEVTCRSRCFLITSRGWIGVGSKVTRPGDDVCIFFGARTPFIVRQLPSAGEALYRLCSPCKIPGIMKGEAIKMWEEGAFNKTTFNII